jgi:parvulin-like peptidyl-prolyl isomerase
VASSLGIRAPRSLVGVFVFLVAIAGCQKDEDPAEAVVARVGDETITVEEVAQYMAGSNYGVNIEAVRKAVDEMVDLYLVMERARERHALTAAESLQLKEWRDVLLINQFRDDVIWSEIQIPEAEARAWYDDNVGEEVRARHVLISVQPTASPEERQQARQEADSLHQALEQGADFATLARQHSDDPTSAQQGGMLEWFRKGDMVEPFEKAAFEGPVGELNPQVVETQFGFHIIQVEERRKPSFEDLREDIVDQLAGPRRSETEQAYITQLMENSGVEFYEQNIDRFIALLDEQPAREPTEEERNLPLASFREGEIMLGELYQLYRNLPPNNQQAIERLDQTQMIQALAALVQQRLVLAEAASRKVELDTTRQRQLDERIDALYLQTYLQAATRTRVQVPDSVVRVYYDEHLEFYGGRPFEEVREQIRQVLVNQRMEEMGGTESQQRLVAGIADSQASRVEVERHEDRYSDVLERLQELYEERGGGPGAQPDATEIPVSDDAEDR